MDNPWKGLAKSRKFLLLILGVSINIILYFTAKYAGESAFADIKFLIGALSAVFAVIINAIAKEDAALKSNGNYMAVLNAQKATAETKECSEEKCQTEGCCNPQQVL